MKFIDLFAGLGGFHQALSSLGHHCVFASELDDELRLLYQQNFGLLPQGNIREISEQAIPSHDILCAGFPCQSFSKAGKQEGFLCPSSGDLFEHVMRIARYHKPTYLILENVPNIIKHNNGKTWEYLVTSLTTLGYAVEHKRLSPHYFSIPQIRERVFIVGSRLGLNEFAFPLKFDNPQPELKSILDINPVDSVKIPQKVTEYLLAWDEFIKTYPKDKELPSFPIWSMEFGATYPYKHMTPYAIGTKRLGYYRGSYGIKLSEFPTEDRFSILPSYARSEVDRFPDWKINYISANRELYKTNKTWIDKWMHKIVEFHSSVQKLEWNCKGEERDLWQCVIQIRASGVRLKRPTTAPSLVAMCVTQVPIIAWEKRYMTPRECARLQSMDKLKHLPSSLTRAYRSLGNAVNVQIVRMIAESLLSTHNARSKQIERC